MMMMTDDDGRVTPYIVGCLIANGISPMGCATCGFVVMLKVTRELVFLKDSWCLDIEGMMGEVHWFDKLDEARNISMFLHGSDVRHVVVKRHSAARKSTPLLKELQHTLTNLYLEDYGGTQGMIGYIHY